MHTTLYNMYICMFGRNNNGNEKTETKATTTAQIILITKEQSCTTQTNKRTFTSTSKQNQRHKFPLDCGLFGEYFTTVYERPFWSVLIHTHISHYA